MKINLKPLGLIGIGFLIGTVGVKLLTSKDAKKVYPHVVAAGLRGKDYVVKTATTVKEDCSDIYAEAKEINERRRQEEAEMEIKDSNEETADANTETDNVPSEDHSEE